MSDLEQHSMEELRRQLEQAAGTVGSLSGQLRLAQQRVNDIRTEIARRKSAVKPGDVCVARKYGNGQERKVLVIAIRAGSRNGTETVVRNILKDGSLGAWDTYTESTYSGARLVPTGETMEVPS